MERELGADLELDFETTDENGDPFVPVDVNFWGTTYVDSTRFFATVGSGDLEALLIVEGNVQTGELNFRFENASCPAVSPDGTTIVAKEQRGDGFQLIAIDVATGSRRDLVETRSVDDQVEWLNDSTILYGLPSEEGGTAAQPALDVWVLDINDGSAPRLFIPFADSPATA